MHTGAVVAIQDMGRGGADVLDDGDGFTRWDRN